MLSPSSFHLGSLPGPQNHPAQADQTSPPIISIRHCPLSYKPEAERPEQLPPPRDFVAPPGFLPLGFSCLQPLSLPAHLLFTSGSTLVGWQSPCVASHPKSLSLLLSVQGAKLNFLSSSPATASQPPNSCCYFPNAGIIVLQLRAQCPTALGVSTVNLLTNCVSLAPTSQAPLPGGPLSTGTTHSASLSSSHLPTQACSSPGTSDPVKGQRLP